MPELGGQELSHERLVSSAARTVKIMAACNGAMRVHLSTAAAENFEIALKAPPDERFTFGAWEGWMNIHFGTHYASNVDPEGWIYCHQRWSRHGFKIRVQEKDEPVVAR